MEEEVQGHSHYFYRVQTVLSSWLSLLVICMLRVRHETVHSTCHLLLQICSAYI